jgi:hypothetical protein
MVSSLDRESDGSDAEERQKVEGRSRVERPDAKRRNAMKSLTNLDQIVSSAGHLAEAAAVGLIVIGYLAALQQFAVFA